MQNLEQIRADNALIASGQKGPRPDQNRLPVEERAVTKLPALIVNNGLLAAAAFAENKGDELKKAMDAVAWHLSDPRIARLPANCRDTMGLSKDLASSSSDKLRLATAEALAFLSYLKRFARPSD